MRRAPERDDRGSTIPLVVGLMLVLLLVIAVAVDAGAAFIRRSTLQTLADGAALAAADAATTGDELYLQGVRDVPLRVTPALATVAVQDHLAEVRAADRFPGLVATVVPGADRVRVTVRAPLRLPLGFPGLDRLPPIGATATAWVTPDL